MLFLLFGNGFIGLFSSEIVVLGFFNLLLVKIVIIFLFWGNLFCLCNLIKFVIEVLFVGLLKIFFLVVINWYVFRILLLVILFINLFDFLRVLVVLF